MTTPTELIAPRSAGTGQIRRLLAAIGAPVVAALRWLFQLTGLATSIVLLTPRWSTWRRTVRTEFARTLQHAVLGAFPATAAAAILIGVGLIYQALYWIEAAGQVDLLGRVIVVVLVREMAPMLVALIIIGHSGTATLIQLTQLRAGGQLRMLDSQGIDPFLLLVLPRIVAFTLAGFTLTILFIVITLFAGYAAANMLGFVRVTFWGYLDLIMRAVRPTDFVLVPVKSLALGFIIGLVCCYTALIHARDATRVVASGFVRAALAVFAVSGLLSLFF